ncbi:MAG: aldo/keto reductase [Candidatus Latescibacteria bacterium]|nr:aldo/keto reductase [Candidatus Latescibacterota bacterium]
MEKRLLGHTGETLSVVGFGGIVVSQEASSTANRLVAQAVERGVNYFDVAPSYGNAEERLGPALEPYRRSVFLACKTGKRTKEEASEELRGSLKCLRTDHFDLYQLHGVNTLEEVERIMGPGGAMEALVEAREQGLVRYLGFSSHAEEAALALLDRFAFDTMLFPFNWVCWHQEHFGSRVLEKAREKTVGILALKALAKRKRKEGEERKWPKCWYAPVEDSEEASLALRFVLSKPITAAPSPSHAELLWWACNAADRFEPLSEEEATEVAMRSEGLDPIFP